VIGGDAVAQYVDHRIHLSAGGFFGSHLAYSFFFQNWGECTQNINGIIWLWNRLPIIMVVLPGNSL
jgi:hypothetical protein